MSDKNNTERAAGAEIKDENKTEGKNENLKKSKLDKAFSDYAREDEIKAADIHLMSDSVYQRFFDVTFGYWISSAAGLFFLTALLPIFYITHDGMAKGTQKLPGLDDIFSALGVGWFLILFISAGFFAGGVALFNSMRAGRSILKYMFTLSALIIIFELRYGISRSGAGAGYDGIIFFLSLILCVVMVIALAAKSSKIKSIRILNLLNMVLITFNTIMILRYFINLNTAMTDRHIHYLTLFFITAILLQTIEAGRTFFPLIFNGFNYKSAK
jgi:hypothetical protein